MRHVVLPLIAECPATKLAWAVEPVGKGDVLQTAESLLHNHGPANAVGLAFCWIHRRHAQAEFGAAIDPGQAQRHELPLH